MLALALATMCSASIALVFKYSEGNDLNRYALTSANYFTAALVSLIMLLTKPVLAGHGAILPAFASEFRKVILADGGMFSASASIAWAILLGMATGIFYFLGFIYYQRGVRASGAGLAGAFSKMSALLPMLLSLLLWRELPGSWQWLGIVLALGSMALIYFPVDKSDGNNFQSQLLFLFFFTGSGQFSNKLFQKYALAEYKNLYLLFIFGTALLISLYFTWRQQKMPKFNDLLAGLTVGIPNLFASYFLIAALDSLPTSVVYPIYSAGGIVLINFGSRLLFKERLSQRQLLSIGLTIVALVMINL